jgi:RNA polymerase sigma-70 factor (ECF subfamily)
MRADGPAVDQLSDEAVLAAIQARDDTALAHLYDRYGRLAFGLAFRVLGDRGVAEDTVQEAFLSVWRHAARYQPGRGGARAWLMAIVHNAAIDRRRGRFKRELTDVQLDDVVYALETDAEDTFATVAERIEAAQIRQALNSLPDEQRRAIELAYFDGLTHQEIAQTTDTPLGTVKSRMRLGLQKLRVVLSDGERETPPGDMPQPQPKPAPRGTRSRRRPSTPSQQPQPPSAEPS